MACRCAQRGERVARYTAHAAPHARSRALTRVHVAQVNPESAAASPPLSSLHTGPWTVLPLDTLDSAADAMRPFAWVARQIEAAAQ